MPLYDYRCLECEHVQEENVKMEARNNDQVCEKCGGRSIHALVTAPKAQTYRLGAAWGGPGKHNLGEV